MTFSPTPDEIADRYAEARPRIVSLVGSLSPAELETPVPGTPKWTVRDLLAHYPRRLAFVTAGMGHLDGVICEVWHIEVAA